jgi:hypothetical protein
MQRFFESFGRHAFLFLNWVARKFDGRIIPRITVIWANVGAATAIVPVFGEPSVRSSH